MASLLALFSAAILAGVGAGVLRGSAPALPPVPALVPTAPLREMVVIPYESPEVISAQLRRMALKKDIEQCLKEESSYLIAGNMTLPVPKHIHMLGNYHRTIRAVAQQRQLV
jgi:hypothetical protein